MFIPEIQVQPLKAFFNVRRICNYLSPEKAANMTLPFAEKTYLLYPELRGKVDGLDSEERNKVIEAAVKKHLTEHAN